MARATGTDAHRDRILKAALNLLTRQGRDAVTTRSVAEAAEVQPPVLYRLFGDKHGLLDAVAAHGFSAYLAKKQPQNLSVDPVEALKTGWDLHVDFGLANPELYLLMYATSGHAGCNSAARQAFEMLEQHMQRVAAVGQLRESLARACLMYHAAAVGVVMSLIATPREDRDLSLSARVRDHTLSGITTDQPATQTAKVPVAANLLGALLSQAADGENSLSKAEGALLLEWLKRMAIGD